MRPAGGEALDAAPWDLLVAGGGINGVGIARDAAGRGLSVCLVERADLAGATSSSSSKLIHGGVRYLEQHEFRLVRESLAEREVLWTAAPHLIRPLRFVLPVRPGLRPPWVLRAGLFLYDHIGGRRRLPPTRTLRGADPALEPLQARYRLAFEYSDCCADDARLVICNAVDACERGARILVDCALSAARRQDDLWQVELATHAGRRYRLRARALVNAAGPWVERLLEATGAPRRRALRLVKGSHIVVPRLYSGDQAYTLQGADRRVVFTIPYEDDFTLIGTTDIPFSGDPLEVRASAQEIDYLCALASEYLRVPLSARDVIWSYAGVRPLHDDGEVSASTITRDYAFDLDAPPAQAPILSIFGGKLTTYRRLAEHALAELLPRLRLTRPAWTREATLPGGDLPHADLTAFIHEQRCRYDFLPAALLQRVCRAYGTRIERVLGPAHRLEDLGAQIAPGLYECELQFMREHEWARSGEDALWRRSKLGLRLDAAARARVAAWFGAP